MPKAGATACAAPAVATVVEALAGVALGLDVSVVVWS
jgi:hypothetical protein